MARDGARPETAAWLRQTHHLIAPDARGHGASELRPRFDSAVMIETLEDAATRSHWPEWQSIACPVLVVYVRGNGDVARMHDLQPAAALVEIPDSGHDVHLDNPDVWRQSVSAWLRETVTAA